MPSGAVYVYVHTVYVQPSGAVHVFVRAACVFSPVCLNYPMYEFVDRPLVITDFYVLSRVSFRSRNQFFITSCSSMLVD